MKIDLHMHSTASDGKLSPEELVDWAAEKRLPAIAVTDHDVLAGSKRAVLYAKDKDVEVVSGVEFGANEEGLCNDIHIVGLFLDLDNEEVNELSRKLMDAREVQKKEIILKLNELGYDITFDELRAEVEGVNYGRPHIAAILIRKYSELTSIGQVFDELLGCRGKAYVVQWKENMKNTIDIIHRAGGVAVLAHPMLYENYGISPRKLIDVFVGCGGDGIEVNYCYKNRGLDNEEKLIEDEKNIMGKYKLIVSGGGDFHRHEDGCEIGDYGIDLEEFEKLKDYWRREWKKD